MNLIEIMAVVIVLLLAKVFLINTSKIQNSAIFCEPTLRVQVRVTAIVGTRRSVSGGWPILVCVLRSAFDTRCAIKLKPRLASKFCHTLVSIPVGELQ